MKKILVAILASLAVLIPIAIVSASPAQAAGGTFWHYSPDDGYDAAFIVEFHNGTTGPLAEGQSLYINKIYVGSGKLIVCRGGGRTYYPGWHYVWPGDGGSNGCVHQLQ